MGLCILSWACSPVGPNYKPPKNHVPEKWHNAPPENASLNTESLAGWWHLFNDPMLDSLVSRVLHCNYDLKTAAAKIREARALFRIQEANMWPNVAFQGYYTREQFSNNSIGSLLPGVQGQQPGSTTPRGISFSRGQDLFQGAFDASWEIDLFGGILRGIQAQKALYCASIAHWRGVTVSLLAETSMNYMELRGYQQQILVAQGNARIQRETLEVTRQRYQAGLVNFLDVARAEAQLATTESVIPPLQTAVKQTIHRLSVLTGQEPGALYGELCRSEPLPVNPPVVPAGIPAQLLCRRPDIREAEQKLAAASAEIGVAEAQLYPQLILAGDVGYQSSNLGNLLSGQSAIYSFGPIINIPIFNAGALAANVRVSKAQFKEALYQYRQTVLLALEEVENALVAYAQEHSHFELLKKAYTANQKSVQLVKEQYFKGLVDFLNVLSAERDLFTAETELLASRIALSTDLVRLYKALGGGWECEEVRIPITNKKKYPPLPCEP
jgi:NodT family efflux transporter outer membrane factor (OMF) lipoprotein